MQGMDMIDYISQVISVIPVGLSEAFLGAWLHFDVLTKRREISLSKKTLTVFFVILYALPVVLFFAFVPNTVWYYHPVNALVRIIPIVLLQILVFCREMGKQIFLLLSLLAGIYTIKIATSMIYSYLTSLSLFALEKILVNINFSNEKTVALIFQISCNALMFLVDVAFVFLFWIYVRMISKAYIYKDEPLHFRESLFLVMPSATILAIVMTFRIIILLTANDVGGIVFMRSDLIKVMLLIISFLMLGTIICDIKLFQQLILHHRDERQRLMLAEELERMRTETDELSDVYGEVRGLRHDMANHIANISALIHSEKADTMEIDKYLEKMSSSIDRMDFGYRTGNPISDIILGRKKSEAEKAGIDCDFIFAFPVELGIDAYDVGVILDNILSNAIRACGSLPGDLCRISLKSRRQGELFFIETLKVLIDEESGEVISDPKGDAVLHGFGLKNVRRIAQKYLGDMEITLSESGSTRVFHITVLLNSVQHPGDDGRLNT